MTIYVSTCYSCRVGEHGCEGGKVDCHCPCTNDSSYWLTCGHCGEVYDDEDEAGKCQCKEAVKQRRIDFECDMADAKRKGEY